MPDESPTEVPKKKTGFFATILGIFKKKKTPKRSETAVSFISDEVKMDKPPTDKIDEEKWFANPLFKSEHTSEDEFHVRFQEQWDRLSKRQAASKSMPENKGDH
uniref:HMG box domain-containing protein n=1 Tax=Caenorhabditis tropicalis TaxID=1561998 RepID=A0A1I7TRL5_9PELO